MIRFQEIDGLLLKKRINRLEEEIAMLKKKLGD
jgi:hypothetical protein